jgi:uncharacterized protein (TIGR02598 family)
MKRFFPTGYQAFSLVEVTLALGIISFGLIAIMGLVPKGLGIVKESADEAAALNILSAVSSDLQCVGSNTTNSTIYQIPVNSVNSGKRYFDIDGNWLGISATISSDAAVYALSWTIQLRSLQGPRAAFISIAWPAKATQPLGSVDCVLVLPGNPKD